MPTQSGKFVTVQQVLDTPTMSVMKGHDKWWVMQCITEAVAEIVEGVSPNYNMLGLGDDAMVEIRVKAHRSYSPPRESGIYEVWFCGKPALIASLSGRSQSEIREALILDPINTKVMLAYLVALAITEELKAVELPTVDKEAKIQLPIWGDYPAELGKDGWEIEY